MAGGAGALVVAGALLVVGRLAFSSSEQAAGDVDRPAGDNLADAASPELPVDGSQRPVRIGRAAGEPARTSGLEDPPPPPRSADRVTAAEPMADSPRTVRPSGGSAVPPASPRRSPASSPGEGSSSEGASDPAGDSRSTGLTGLSQEYSDFHCQRIQHQFGVEVPQGATVLEVDGQVLPLTGLETLPQSHSPILFLPRGLHQLRFRPGERLLETRIEADFVDTYSQMRTFFAVDREIRKEDLLRRSARAMDVHATPLLLNLLGAAYARAEQWEAAERKFRRALHVNPLYGPAHLNLAHCLARREAAEAAAAELRQAAAVNVGNVFGINAGISELRRQLDLEHQDARPVAIDVARYISHEPLSVEDQRLIAMLEALSKYALRDEERAKILNNLGVHFADTSKPELALNFYREALAALKVAGPDRFRLASQVIGHMSDACEKAGFAEAAEYQWMRGAVTP